MDISQFLNNVAAGNASQAKETLTDILSARAFESIDDRKKELSQTLFGGRSEEIEVQDTADSEIEEDELLTQEEFNELSGEDQELYLEALEQLDELSNKTLHSYLRKTQVGGSSDLRQQSKTPHELQDYGRDSAKDRIKSRKGELDRSGYEVKDGKLVTTKGPNIPKGYMKKEEVEELVELSKTTLRNYLKGSRTENQGSLGPAGHMSDKARSLGRTEQDKEDGRYEGQKLAKRKLGAPGTIAAKVMAK